MDDYEHDLMEMQEEANGLGKMKNEVRIMLVEMYEDGALSPHLHLLMCYMADEDTAMVLQEDCLADQEE